jgi:hypothetical protein
MPIFLNLAWLGPDAVFCYFEKPIFVGNSKHAKEGA